MRGISKPAGAEGVGHQRSDRRWRQTPGLVDQFRQRDPAPAGPSGFSCRPPRAGGPERESSPPGLRLREAFSSGTSASSIRRSGSSRLSKRRTIRLHYPKVDARVLPPQPLHHGEAEARQQRFGAADPQFSRRGVGQELDLVHACSQIVEDRDAALEQSAAVRASARRLGGCDRTGARRARLRDRRSIFDTTGWEIARRLAAFAMLPHSATAITTFKCCSLIR